MPGDSILALFVKTRAVCVPTMQGNARKHLAGLQEQVAALCKQGLQLQQQLCTERDAITAVQATSGCGRHARCGTAALPQGAPHT